MALTLKEVWLIEAIVSNEYSSNNYRLPAPSTSYKELTENSGHTCWTNTIEYNGAKHGQPCIGKEISGTVSSLVKKGFVTTSGFGTPKSEACVTVTAEGWKAYQKAMEV